MGPRRGGVGHRFEGRPAASKGGLLSRSVGGVRIAGLEAGLGDIDGDGGEFTGESSLRSLAQASCTSLSSQLQATRVTAGSGGTRIDGTR